MNRFLTKKKAKDFPEEVPSVFSSLSNKKTKKWKKGQPEPKPKLDLAAVLPSNDDFRTSLIMPNLSARFSMLRDQDDPNSLMGKASDDSVLHPKRQSRLYEFGFKPAVLTDIAEVSSIHSSSRPNFARQDSMDTAGTDDGSNESGSVMARARPGEGNVLFGGRQKVYKVSASGSASNLGKAVYGDDLSLSAFQKTRRQEREQQQLMPRRSDEDYSRDSEEKADKDSYSSLLPSSQRRETSSSTTSGPPSSTTRTSTAATSTASQGANSVGASSPPLQATQPPGPVPNFDRSVAKTRRLYEHGLDQHIHDQQNSAMSRLNSIQNHRQGNGAAPNPLMAQSKSTSNLGDRFNRFGNPSRAVSPPPTPSPNHPLYSNRRDGPPSASGPTHKFAASTPVSPISSDGEDRDFVLSAALQPNDRGKATAMGAFNKPKKFDEQQYMQRQIDMQRGRETPSGDRPESPAPLTVRQKSNSPKPPVEEKAAAPTSPNEVSPSEQSLPAGFSAFHRAANQMRAVKLDSPQHSPDAESPKTFLHSPNDSESDQGSVKSPVRLPVMGYRRESQGQGTPSSPLVPPPILEHPALRSESPRGFPRVDTPQSGHHDTFVSGVAKCATEKQDAPAADKKDPEIDSPTLGPNNGGLNGLVRAHLRNSSNVSSIYPEDTDAPLLALQTNGVGNFVGHNTSETNTPAHSSYTHSNPWDLEELENSYGEEVDSQSSTSPVAPQKPKDDFPLKETKALGGQKPSGGPDGQTVPHWERELRKKHARGGSTETQQEREAFDNELAQRRKAIGEALKHRAEEDEEPQRLPNANVGISKRAMGMLRSKSSRDSFTQPPPRPQESSKAFKMLGLGSGASSTSLSTITADYPPERPYSKESSRSEDNISQLHSRPYPRAKVRSPMRSSPIEHGEDQERERVSRFPPIGENPDMNPKKTTSPPSSSKSSMRNRSSSEVSSGRSQSRTRRYRDDLQKAMMEGTGSSTSHNVVSPTAFAHNHQVPASKRPSMESFGAHTEVPIAGQGAKVSGESKREEQGYFGPKTSLQPIRTGISPPGASPGADGLSAPRISPMPSPFSINSTPPISSVSTPAASTPVTSNFGPVSIVPGPSAVNTNRKKSINKSDISEPVLLSSTSVVDTVPLPPGASLKNGMEDVPPPLPPINPRRRRFGLARIESAEPASPTYVNRSPHLPFNSTTVREARQKYRQRLRKTSSEGHSLRDQAQAQGPTSIAHQMQNRSPTHSPPRPTPNGVMF